MTTKTMISEDGVFEIQQNHLLSNRQYMLKVYSYNNSVDIRMSNSELKELVTLINSLVDDSEPDLFENIEEVA